MNTEIIGVFAMYLLVVVISIPLGRYIGKIILGQRTWLDGLFVPLENLLLRVARIDGLSEMRWQDQLRALLLINAIWFVLCLFVLCNLSWLPLNPDGNPSMSWHLAFNTTVSFITNTNLQHYSGETGLSYLGQLVLMLWQFLSAATGMAISAMVMLSMRPAPHNGLGNFFHQFIKMGIRVLFPLCLLGAVILLWNGTPMTFDGKVITKTLEGARQEISQGPVAAFVAIKQLGTNGGGFFGPNSANPMENPNYITNMLETIFILLIPMALITALSYVTTRRKLALMIHGVMMGGFLMLMIPAIYSELKGNPAFQPMGINQEIGSMEGKEVRFGAAASAYWAINTTCTSNGSVNSMHDSMTPITGLMAMLGMMVNGFYGGVGVGFLNFYIFLLLSVFIGGLMVGRTPEFLGKKVEAREIKIAVLITLLHPLLILGGTALATIIYVSNPEVYASWLANPGAHGFSEMLYEFTSSSANNGSGFEGLGDNTPFWNLATGIVMLLARYLPIIGPVAIAGYLSAKQTVPEGTGTLKTDTGTFGVLVMAVILIVAALSFFPALTLGPVAEYFLIY